MTHASARIGRWALLGIFVSLLPGLVRADGKISGTVKDGAGEGVPEVRLQLIPEDTNLTVSETKTKKNGVYFFGLVRPGRYRLMALKEGLRVSRIDVDKFEPPEEEPSWTAHVDVPPGAKIPYFQMASNSEATFDLRMTPTTTGPGEFGTGEPLVAMDAILKMVEGGEHAKAEAEILRNLGEKPDSAVWQYLHAFTLFSQDKGEDALAAVDRAIALDPAFEGASLLRGKILEKAGRTEDAAAAFRAETGVAKTQNGLRDAWLALAVAEEKLGRKEDAAAALEKVIEIAPDMTDAYYELADLYTQMGRIEKVQEVNEKLKASGKTEDPNILFNVGADRFNKGDMKGAADVFARIVQINPDFADAWLQLGYAQINLGEKQAARASLEKYLELKPDGADAAMARAFLEKISK